jgi:hypothetical protein
MIISDNIKMTELILNLVINALYTGTIFTGRIQ